MQTNVGITLVFHILMFYVQNGVKTGHVHGNRICNQQLCTKVDEDCNPSFSLHANDTIECTQTCINNATCEMVAYYPFTGVCNLHTCIQCYLSVLQTQNVPTVFLCTTDCGDPPTPANGTVSLTNTGPIISPSGTTSTTPGATATQSCNTGYNLSGTTDISCGTDGSWSDQPVTCSLIDCGLPVNPDNGTVLLSNDGITTYNSTAIQSCNIGYDLNGTTNITCGANGNWSHPAVICIIRDCGNPPTPANGTITLTNTSVTTLGATATQTCNTGYNLSGTADISCGTDGSWSDPPATCALIDCGLPVNPDSGTVLLSNDGITTYNSTAIQSCNIGYDLNSTTNITCGANRNWSHPAVICIIRDCGSPINPDNGTVILTEAGITTFGADATQSCNIGYDVIGIANITCGADGNWNGSAVTCTIKGFSTGQVHGNRICTEPLCTRVGDDCSLISSPDVNNKSACKQACINKETCKMAAYHQTTGCNLYKCTVCYLQTNGGNNQAIYMCTYVAGCGHPPTPENGRVTLTNTGITSTGATATTTGATATQTCNTGYSLSGKADRTCEVDGSWSDQPVTCSLIDCGSPTSPSNGGVLLPGPGITTYGAFATQRCDIGYDLTGVSNITCLGDGKWSEPAVTCTIKDCGSPASPSNGSVLLSDPGITTYGAFATQRCDIGYDLTGVSNITCLGDGKWSEPAVTCTIKDCGSPTSPSNGSVLLAGLGITTYGAFATQQCDIGYDLTGVTNITCTANGNWSGPAVICTIKDCGSPTIPSNGSVLLAAPGITTYGVFATQLCDIGFDLTGVANITCAADGNWSDSAVVCTIKDCGSPTSPSNGSVLLSNPGITTYGASATQRCDIGYDLTGVANITCTADGTWSGPAVICTIKDCGSPTPPSNGSVLLADPSITTYGACATQRCDIGYDLTGVANIMCTADGNWSGPAVICTIKDCGSPTIPSNGSVLLKDPSITTYGACATQRCDIGYDLTGVANISCTADGTWSGPAVICIIKDCGSPTTPGNGSVLLAEPGITTYGVSAAQQCNIGYDLTGVENIMCSEDGNWSYPAVICTIKDCGSPTTPGNGSVLLAESGITTYGVSATQRCNIGYDLTGVANITCTADGNWSYPAVICTIKDCNNPIAPRNGTTTLTIAGLTTYESTARVSCNHGYTLSGNATMVCRADGLWSLNAECIIKDCKAPEQPRNGILKLTVDGVTTYGATAAVSCNTGYELVGDSFVRCRADGIWSSLPSCDFKGFIAALAAIGGVTCLGLAAVAGYWFIIRKCMKNFRTVSSVKSDESDGNDHGVKRMHSTDGYTQDVKW